MVGYRKMFEIKVVRNHESYLKSYARRPTFQVSSSATLGARARALSRRSGRVDDRSIVNIEAASNNKWPVTLLRRSRSILKILRIIRFPRAWCKVHRENSAIARIGSRSRFLMSTCDDYIDVARF